MIDLYGRLLNPLREPAQQVIGVCGKNFSNVVEPRAGLFSIAALDCWRRYRLKQSLPARSIQPPPEIIRFSTSIGSPGAQVICSTGRFCASHAFGFISPLPIWIGGM